MSRIGRLDQRITFQSFTTAPDGAGGKVKTWADLGSVPTVWAQVVPGGGGERFEEERQAARQSVTFRVRTRADLTEAMRILWDGVAYNIRSLPDIGTREPYMRIETERGVGS